MKVLITHPKRGTAISRLAEGVVKYNTHHEFRVVEVHPKRPDPLQLEKFLEAYEWCDIWDAQYWKTAEMLIERFNLKEGKNKPWILEHHNPYDLLDRNWDHYNKLVVHNGFMKKVLPNALNIPLAVDFDEFAWNPEYTEKKTVLMVAQRIEGSKGVEPVARACKELGYPFYLVGQISDMNYFQEVIKHANVTFMENIPDEELLDVYRKSAILVCNSKDNFESGTLPILEAMAIGVPVLTRPIGHVPDLFNEKNMIVREGEQEDVDELKALLKDLMEDRERRLAMREEAWHTVRNYSTERRARRFSQLYYKTHFKNTLVSVVMPVFGNPENLAKTIEALNDQTYPALELVIVSDGDPSFDNLSIRSKHTVKYIRVGEYHKYGLGYARDKGVLEAEGDILVFLDQRFIPEPSMIEEFVKNLTPKHWLYGNKNNKRNFVENVSCLYRQEFIEMGMSNQLIDGYGGMSQELRERSRRQGFKHVFIEKAIATAQYSSHNYNGRKDDIRRIKEVLWKLNLT